MLNQTGLARPKYEHNGHCYINEDTRSIFISQRDDSTMYHFYEMCLDTLDYKRKIGPGAKFTCHFYFSEAHKKIFQKTLSLPEMKV